MHLYRKAITPLGPQRGFAHAGRVEAAPFGRSEAGGPEVSAFALDNGLDGVGSDGFSLDSFSCGECTHLG